jgi:twinkle protein
MTLTHEHAAHLKTNFGIEPSVAEALGAISGNGRIGFEYRLFSHMKPALTKWVRKGMDPIFEPKDRGLIPWGLDSIKAPGATLNAPLIIVADEFERMSLVQAGFKCVISVPDRNKVGSLKGDFDWMLQGGELLPELQEPDKIILAMPDNQPGYTLREELAIRLNQDRCWTVLRYPAGCRTINAVLKNHGVEWLRTLIDGAIPLVQDKLASISEIPEMGEREQYRTGWSVLDPHLVICPPELLVVTGTPGSGKSNFTLNLCLNLARLHKLPGAYIQFEDNAERMRRDILLYAEKWKDTPDTDGVCNEPREWADWACKIIKPAEEEEDKRDLKWVHETIHEAATRHGCRWVVLDPWNEVEHMWASDKTTETKYLNDAIRELKRLVRRYRIALFIVAHPDKLSGMNQGIDEMDLYSIAGGATWNNKADGGIVVAREKGQQGYTNGSDVKISKRKDHELMGIPGKVRFEFDHKSRTYLARS